MRWRRCLAFILCLGIIFMGTPAFAGEAANPKMAYVNTDEVHVRTGAGTNKAPLKFNGSDIFLYKGQYVQVVGTEKDSGGDTWDQITFKYFGHVHTGYMKATYVTEFSFDSQFEEYLTKQGFPESYKPYLRALYEAYGKKWIFVAYKTGLDWNRTIQSESKLGVSLVSGSNTALRSTAPGAYDSSTGTWKQYEPGWYAANSSAVAFYMDPRNYLIDGTCFCFEKLSANESITFDQLKKAFAGYDWATDQIIQEFINAGKEANVSALFLASRAKQELGRSATANASGCDVYGDGKLYYNFFNIGASDSNDPNHAGLVYASDPDGVGSYGRPWDTSYKAILGGAKFLSESYIGRGQNTLYLQKFNITSNNTYNHQYMTNIMAPWSEGWSSYKVYRNLELVDTNFEFIIPIYENMPDVTELPIPYNKPVIVGAEDVTLNKGDSFNIMAGVTAHDAAGTNLTSAISVAGSVDTNKEGTYTLTYWVTDSNGNNTTVNRVVTIKITIITISGTLTKGMSGDEVLAVQKRLHNLGYLAVTPDGIYGNMTEAAVIMFQAANGLETPDGKVDNWTVGKLNSDDVVAFSSLSKGSTGTAVKVMQKYLVKLRYLSATPDGIFGNMSYTALKEFQAKNGLAQTGIADQATLAKLYHVDAQKGNLIIISGTLTKGMSGDEVLAVQERLHNLGYLAVTPDGTYDNTTEAAVIMFQAANGLETPDGKVDNWTVGKLNLDDVAAFSSLSKGSTGTAVKVMQNYLVKLRYLSATPDGIFGNMSYAALKEFQAKNGLAQTGIADQATLAKLYHVDAQKGNLIIISSTLTKGMSGDEVLAVQERLHNLGYLAVTPDGTYDNTTEAAVIMFQAANGLETPDGKVGNWTVGKLNSDDVVAFSSLLKGSTGTAVKVMQKYLVKLRYLSATPDGIFGNMSYAAIEQFQRNNELTQTGIADQATLAKLYHVDAQKGNLIIISSTLTKGMSGDEVLEVQERLHNLGYLAVTPDGIYGNMTEAAVIMFQAANGLETPDGKVGNWTVGKLNLDDVVAFSSLSKGSTGTAVKVMQKYLVKLRYLSATPDGIFGNMSYAALKEFQVKNGLEQTGIADQATLAKLYHAAAIRK